MKKLFARSFYKFPLTVSVDALRETMANAGFWRPQGPHYHLAKTVAENGTVGPDHPYNGYIGKCELPRPEDRIKAAVAAVKDMLANGIREPIDLLVDNSGVLYPHGYHRMGVVEYLGDWTRTMKVTVHLCTPELVKLADALFSIYDESTKYHTYQPLIQVPGFSLCPQMNANLPQKAGVILAHVHRDLPFVDFGAHMGFVTRTLQAAGLRGVAVECDAKLVDLMPLMETFGYKPITYHRTSIEQYMTSHPGRCVGVFCSILHHYFRAKSPALESTIVPWMQANCVQAFVEHDFPWESSSLQERLAYWSQAGFVPRTIYVETDGQRRTMLKLTNTRTVHHLGTAGWPTDK